MFQILFRFFQMYVCWGEEACAEAPVWGARRPVQRFVFGAGRPVERPPFRAPGGPSRAPTEKGLCTGLRPPSKRAFEKRAIWHRLIREFCRSLISRNRKRCCAEGTPKARCHARASKTSAAQDERALRALARRPSVRICRPPATFRALGEKPVVRLDSPP